MFYTDILSNFRYILNVNDYKIRSVVLMFCLEFVNCFTQEVLRHAEYEDKDKEYVNEMLDTLRSAKEDIIIFDNTMNPSTARYLTHVLIREDGVKTFRVLFKIKQSNRVVNPS